MSEHRIPYGAKPCADCNGEAVVIINVGGGGFSCSPGFNHKEDCKSLFCPHGRRWNEECLHCEAEEEQAAHYEA